MATSNLFIPSNVKGDNNLLNDFTMPLLQPIDAVNSNVSMEVINVSYPKSITNVMDDQFFFNFNLKYKKYSPFCAKNTNYFYANKKYHIFYSYLGHANNTELVSDKVRDTKRNLLINRTFKVHKRFN